MYTSGQKTKEEALNDFKRQVNDNLAIEAE